MSAAKAVRHPARGSRPQVLVLGGGFAGIGAAQKLRKHEVDVVIVDGHDYHTFQPLLYQVATDLLALVTVGHPLRDLFDDQPNARVHTTEVTSVDLEKRRAEFAEMDRLDYDYLVLALGARVNFFGVKGASEHAFPLYTLADAVRLKEHILERWEAADKDPDLIGDGARCSLLRACEDRGPPHRIRPLRQLWAHLHCTGPCAGLAGGQGRARGRGEAGDPRLLR